MRFNGVRSGRGLEPPPAPLLDSCLGTELRLQKKKLLAIQIQRVLLYDVKCYIRFLFLMFVHTIISVLEYC